MPHFDIIRQAQPQKSFRVASVMGTYDLQDNSVREHFVGDISLPPPENWNVGLIVGASGTGKTTIARELFENAYICNFEYSADSVLDDMPQSASVQDICRTFSSVGFSSVPSWLKPYAVLSNGEKMRVDLARALLSEKDLIVFDEFTSVVDRNVAKIGSFATQKNIRRAKKHFIAVSCHYDIEEWLLPDWVFDTNSMTFRVCGEQKKNRPVCELRVYETNAKEYYWNIFKKHHYLSHNFNKAARVFVATLNGDLCAFSSVLAFPHPYVRNYWRDHRTVVLPDFQGLNIGLHISVIIAEELKKQGKKYVTTTSNIARIMQLINDKRFKMTSLNRKKPGASKMKSLNRRNPHSYMSNRFNSSNRITASFIYVG